MVAIETLSVPLFSAKYVNQNFDFNGAFHRVVNNHHYILGEEVYNFEKEFAHYLGVDYCVTLANGTDAIELALRALDVGKDDKVITVANAGFYSSTAIYAVGGIPIYIDVEETTLTMCPQSLEDVLKTNPKAIIVTHLYGQLANIGDLVSIARSKNIPLIEDCAQGHGAKLNNKLAGSFGTISCFSFYPTKNLGALGDGGAIATNDLKLAEKIKSLRQYGWTSKYHVSVSGGRNSRLDEIQAAILRDKLPKLEEANHQRRYIAKKYYDAFSCLPVQLPTAVHGDFVAHLYVMRTKERDIFRDFLLKRGIHTDIHYPIIDYFQTAYVDQRKAGFLERTERAVSEIVTIPCFPNMPKSHLDHVICSVNDFFTMRTSC